MAKYRKKPVVIDAVRVSELLPAARSNWVALPDWVKERYERGGVVFISESEGMNIKTLEGVMHAEPSDWLIRGVQGEIYPCKPDIFEATYEAVEE